MNEIFLNCIKKTLLFCQINIIKQLNKHETSGLCRLFILGIDTSKELLENILALRMQVFACTITDLIEEVACSLGING